MEGKTGVAHRLISSTQCKAIVELVSREPTLHSISSEGKASLVDMAAAGSWHGDDLETVLRVLDPEPQKTAKGRRPMQHFAPSILSYFLETEWTDTLLNDQTRPFEKLDLIFRRVEQLSGRNLTEPCFKFISSVFLFITEGDAAWRMSTSVKHSMKESVKDEYKRRVRFLGRPDPYIVVLNSSPDDLADKHPTLYSNIFGQEKPSHCKLDLPRVIDLDNTYRCRSLGGGQIMSPSALQGQGSNSDMFALMSMTMRPLIHQMQHLTDEARSLRLEPPTPNLRALQALAAPLPNRRITDDMLMVSQAAPLPPLPAPALVPAPAAQAAPLPPTPAPSLQEPLVPLPGSSSAAEQALH